VVVAAAKYAINIAQVATLPYFFRELSLNTRQGSRFLLPKDAGDIWFSL
jgi:hypothetical protein